MFIAPAVYETIQLRSSGIFHLKNHSRGNNIALLRSSGEILGTRSINIASLTGLSVAGIAWQSR
jgi:hypothetical protein